MDEKGIEIEMGQTLRSEEQEGFFLGIGEDRGKVYMKEKMILSEEQMDAAIAKMARQIIKNNQPLEDVILIGIRSRGVPLANWLAEKIKKFTKKNVKVGTLDINLYRDDLSEVDEQPIVRSTELPVPVNGKGIILVDDVLFTGRTIRSALDALVDFGRPKYVHLAVLIDRGWREFPIQADYVAKKMKTTAKQNIKVLVEDIDGSNEVKVQETKD